jgi:hypothetical protein
MTWQRRLIELSVAGGTLAGCFHDPIPCGNANPDPCICGRTPDPDHNPQCIAEKACTDEGGFWVFDGSNGTDAGVVTGHCESLADAAPHD